MMKTRRLQNPRGFTLLELLVVVAILAAIAGTATIALQDTDARAAAAAHVAMMDELNKGVRTYRVLQKNVLPNNWDSLLSDDGGTIALLPNSDGEVLGAGDLTTITLNEQMADALTSTGIENLRIIDTAATGIDGEIADQEDCKLANIQALISSRKNAVVAGNIFLSPASNGCGKDYEVADGITVAVWNGGNERVLGADAVEPDFAGTHPEGAKILMAVGAGPSCSLFDASRLGALTSVPVYRHVGPDQYNRFIVLFHIATADSTGALVAEDQPIMTTVVDGAGDTKEEELGEWDGSRNTI